VVREYHKWMSVRLERDMELLVFGHGGARVLVFPTREGRFFDYENWGLVESLRHRIEAGAIQLFCVDSVDSESLYGRGRPPHQRIARHNEYERYILDEVVPFTEVKNDHPDLVAHGCSIGAYHSVNIAFRHPEVFRRVVALSGRYDLTRNMGPFPDLFDGHYSEDIYFHTPNHFIPNLWEEETIDRLRRLDVTLAVGREDLFEPSNRDLSGALWNKDVAHRLEYYTGEAHRARYWREMIPRYF
jgi:esterase/lipase superfamily enzyme